MSSQPNITSAKTPKVTVGSLLQRTRDDNHLNSVMLELTYACNLDCTFCYNDLGLSGKRLSLQQYYDLLLDLQKMGVMMLTLTGGEPLVHQHFFEIGARARELGFLITIKSNGVTLNASNAQRLRSEVDPYRIESSLHGATAAVHDRQTQVDGSFGRLVRNIGIVQKLGMRISLNAPLTSWNEHEAAGMFELADRLNVALRFDSSITPRDDGDRSPLQISPTSKGVDAMIRLSNERARQAMGDKDTLPLNLSPLKPPPPVKQKGVKRLKICGTGSSSMTIDPVGNMYPCVQLRRALGNVHKQTVSEVWNSSEELLKVRELAADAYVVAKENGIEQYCMGTAALMTGDPLKPADEMLETSRSWERTNW